jgi:hypothetical protein
LIEQFIGDTEPIQPQLKKYSNHQPEVIDLNQLKRAYNLAVHHYYTYHHDIDAYNRILKMFSIILDPMNCYFYSNVLSLVH